MIAHHWISDVLAPWSDQEIAPQASRLKSTPFFNGMTPAEVKCAFDRLDLDFADYLTIGIVQNPFSRMAALYDRIRSTDALWRLKARVGWQEPEFNTWLASGRWDGGGVLPQLSPRWRRLGAMSTQEWSGGLINSFVRTEYTDGDLRKVFRQLGVIPAIDLSARQKKHRFKEMLRYDSRAVSVIQRHFGQDLRLYGALGSRLDLAA